MDTEGRIAQTELDAMSDMELVTAYREGSEEAVTTLLARYREYIYRLCYRFMRNYEDAMDLMQEALIRIVRGLKTYEERSYFKGWTYRIISNAAINMHKSAARREIPADKTFEWLKDSRANVEEGYEQTYLKERIQEASAKLGGKQHDVFFLRYYEMMSYEEISAALNMSATSAKSNYFYALQKMKKHLEAMGVTL